MKLRNLLAAVLLALVQIVASETAWAADGHGVRAPRNAHEKLNREDLAAPLRERGEVRVIVGLETLQEIGERVDRAPDQLKAQAVAARQQRVLQRLAGHNLRNVKRFRWHHFVAMTVDAAALDSLLADPEVTSVAEDRPNYPQLLDTPVITRADAAWAEGFRGGGQAVAIIDSGVASDHPFFTGKVVAEACFSAAAGNSTTYCPNGQSQQIGAGAGINCPDTDFSCWHGTHVAGIATGRTGVLAPNRGGMAPDAQVIAIQVFQRDCSSGTCVMTAYDSDLLHALEHVYSLRTTYNIASANMSLGGAPYTLNCDGESPAITSAIQSLRAAGIATVISSGNGGNAGAITFPACISSAISVGSTDKLNVISSFSNSASFLSLLAPGNSVLSSMPGGGYGTASGTSMAGPHVAGAWAVLKSVKPTATVTEVLTALQNTGIPITDPRNGRVKPLIQIGDTSTQFGAIGVLLGQHTPPSVSLTAPADGANFAAPAHVTITAAPSANRAAISRVEFYSGSNKIHETTTAPYTFIWGGVPTGTYALTARVQDNIGGTADSQPVGISVNPSGPSFQLTGTILAGGSPLAQVAMAATNGVSCSSTNSSGQYSCTVPQGWSGSVTPWRAGYFFAPGSRTYGNVAAAQAGQDYSAQAPVVWLDDAVPAGAVADGQSDGWNWVSVNPTPMSGTLAHQSALLSGQHQHQVTSIPAPFLVNAGDTLFTHVYLDRANPPSEIMLKWNDGVSGEHRAYWGANLMNAGVDGTESRRFMGELPPVGQWVRLEVPAVLVGLEGKSVAAMGFTLFNGRATWDYTGKLAAITSFQVSGTVTVSGGGALAGVVMAATGGVSCSNTNGSGQYSCTVPQGWSGSVTPSLSGYTFAPVSRSYSSVAANQTAQNYTASVVAPPTFQVSGTVTVSGGGALAGVVMAATGGVSCSNTNGSGQYSCTVPQGWSGTVTPSLSGRTFAPVSRSYSSVAASQAGQNYTASVAAPATFQVSGTVTVSGGGALASVVVAATGGVSCSNTNGSGQYSCTVPQGWSGSVIPSLSGYVFTPVSRAYSNVAADQVAQDYAATAVTVWSDDAVPPGSVADGQTDGWNWVGANPTPVSGALAHQSALLSGQHQHQVTSIPAPFPVNAGDTLFTYVYLDPVNPPSEIMLKWNDGVSGEHRAYWGANLMNVGVDGTAGRRFMGALPPTGQWVRLEVPAALVELVGKTVAAMAFTLYNGRATWDYTGKIAAATSFQVSGTVTVSGGGALASVVMAATNGVICSNTNGSGQYSCTVPQGWSGSVTPSLSGYTFAPVSRSYSSVVANQTAQNYTASVAAPPTFQVSGTVTVSGGGALASVLMAATNGVSCSNTNGSGQYSCTVPQGWSGSVTPSLSGYTFAPVSRSYSSVAANQTAQNYTASVAAPPTFQVSGTVTVSGGGALAGVVMAATGGVSCSNTNGSGQYSCTVPQGWSGSVIPSRSGYIFTPVSRGYSNVAANQVAQDYAATTVVVWFDDAVPPGSVADGQADGWNWVSANPTPVSGTLAHQSALLSGSHQHQITSAPNPFAVGVGDLLFTYVYLDPANPPSEIMLKWNDGVSGEHRAYWGANLINVGTNGTASRRFMGALPPTGQWVRLEVPAALVGLEGTTLAGMAFTLFNGRATWDYTGKIPGGAPP